ncbi:DNA-directed RNA polymerase subunit beta [Streptococcus hillyeri]|uniref:DNA-directed RNA polymerase subunit beta n=1 Tax=Streptococcus hillyeri TaxID=2282420 RepID=A0A3L9DV48_9STRE|nr:DNA-directed RNA polymerase subunit beta [Streptococcus hillyeri]RLY05356.1 DNA-directed RNA polymerase subunit beta [Streptococcus hillyeri]
MDIGWKYIGKQFLLIFVILVLCIICFGLGLVLGYGFFGDGAKPFSILSPEKWQGIISKFTGQ